MKETVVLLMFLLAGCGSAGEDKTDEVLQPSDEAELNNVDEDVDETPDPNNAEGEDPVDEPRDPVDDPGNSDDPPDEPVDGVVTLAELYEPLFVASGCTAGYCHGTFGSADAVHDLIGQDAAQPVCGRTKFIVPGEPEQSILWIRTRDTTDEDIECEVVKMPRNRSENLDPEITQMLHDWIAAGANR